MVLISIWFPRKQNKKTYDVVTCTIYYHLIILIWRVGKSDSARTKPRRVTVRFVCINVCHKVFANKQKLKEKGITENLTKLRLVKLNKVREQHSFRDVLSYDGKAMYKDSNYKAKVIHNKYFKINQKQIP